MRLLLPLLVLFLAAPLAAQPTVTVAPTEGTRFVYGKITWTWMDESLHAFATAEEAGPREIVWFIAAVEDGEVRASAEAESAAYGHPEAEAIAARGADGPPAWRDYLADRRPLARSVREVLPGDDLFPGNIFFPSTAFSASEVGSGEAAVRLAREAAPEAFEAGEPLIALFGVDPQDGGRSQGAVVSLRTRPGR